MNGAVRIFADKNGLFTTLLHLFWKKCGMIKIGYYVKVQMHWNCNRILWKRINKRIVDRRGKLWICMQKIK